MSSSRTLGSITAVLLLLAPVSSALGAEDTRQSRGDITITYNGELDRAHGVRRGSGTMRDPYVISGWRVNNLSIRDTDKVIMIMDNTITGQLTLDWVGHHVHVMNNDIGDLRVNQNNARWGDPMGGPIVGNTITQVGQLRHFDGLFAKNTVGIAPAEGDAFPAARAVNFDGFNGARFTNNTLYGYMDARLHGHHHGSSFRAGSHEHADHDDVADHAKRYHRGSITNNTIYTSAEYALAYLDTNHASNDRTANSETNPYLNAPHVHFTRVTLAGNELVGAGLLVNVFNANDERHTRLARGRLSLVGNAITIGSNPLQPFRALNGIEVRQARSLALRIERNRVTADGPLLGLEPLRAQTVRGAGIALDTLETAAVFVRKNTVINRQYGIHAARLTSDVTWRVTGLQTKGVAEPVAYENSVHNPPERS